MNILKESLQLNQTQSKIHGFMTCSETKVVITVIREASDIQVYLLQNI